VEIEDDPPLLLRVRCHGDPASVIQKAAEESLLKGRRVGVTGSLRRASEDGRIGIGSQEMFVQARMVVLLVELIGH
jgi:hypothetical protein